MLNSIIELNSVRDLIIIIMPLTSASLGHFLSFVSNIVTCSYNVQQVWNVEITIHTKKILKGQMWFKAHAFFRMYCLVYKIYTCLNTYATWYAQEYQFQYVYCSMSAQLT